MTSLTRFRSIQVIDECERIDNQQRCEATVKPSGVLSVSPMLQQAAILIVLLSVTVPIISTYSSVVSMSS